MPDPDKGFPLPLVVDPPRICIQIEIPNDQNHIAAFLGNFVNLGYWFNWQRDADHTGMPVSQIWYQIFLQVAKQISLGGNCPTDTGFAGADDGSEFMIRQNPDNPCLLESSVNGTDWCVFADISKCMNFGTQPGTGTTPPAQGGGTQQTCAKLNANGKLLLPAVVNAGDTITLDDANGAGSDPDDPAGAITARWRLPNGDAYFGGLDIGLPVTDSTDPLPSVNHMKLIAGLSDGSYLDLTVGTPVTIPGGVVNAQIWIQVNDGILMDDQGSYDVCATVKNNQNGAWVSTLDFTANPYDGVVNHSFGDWEPGLGYPGGLNGSVPNWVQVDFTIDSASIDAMTMIYDAASIGGGSVGMFFQVNSGAFGGAGTPIVTTGAPFGASSPTPGVTSIVAVVSTGTTGGADHIQKLTINGHGPKPSQLP